MPIKDVSVYPKFGNVLRAQTTQARIRVLAALNYTVRHVIGITKTPS